MNDEYFLSNAVTYAKNQGRTIEDKEFVTMFQKQLDNLPASKVLRKKWLALFISTTTESYNAHISKMKGNCQTHCQYTLAYKRGVPHAQAELLKIDPIFLMVEKIALFLKRLPSWLLGKWTWLFKL